MPSRFRHAFGCAAVLIGLALTPVAALAQDTLPDQMIHGALESDPISDPRPAPVRFVATWMELPDLRNAQLYRLSWWTKVGRSHAAQISLDYVGLQSQESYRFGGGRSLIRWTSRIGSKDGYGLALDLGANLPLGDETLFPLSARAPMGTVRVRASVLRVGFARIWVGWWARRTSPPSESNREDPISGFASGTGFDGLMEWRMGPLDVDWILHLPTGGTINRVFHWTVNTDCWLSSDVALRLGFGLDTGPQSDRSYNYAIQVGATWRPGAGQTDG